MYARALIADKAREKKISRCAVEAFFSRLYLLLLLLPKYSKQVREGDCQGKLLL